MIHGKGSQFGNTHDDATEKIPEPAPKRNCHSSTSVTLSSVIDLMSDAIRREQSRLIRKRDNHLIVRLKVLKIEIKQLKSYIDELE